MGNDKDKDLGKDKYKDGGKDKDLDKYRYKDKDLDKDKDKDKNLGKGLSSRLLRCALGGELSGPVDSAEESVGAPVWVRGQHSYFLVMFSEPRMKISEVTVMNIALPYGVGVVIRINIKMRGKY